MQVRVSSFGPYEVFGLTEWVMDSPFSIVSVKWITNDSLVYKISKEDLFYRLKLTKSIVNAVTQKLSLLKDRMAILWEKYLLLLTLDLSVK